jgi:hypothetical protein
MDAPENESSTPEERDPLRAYALHNAAKQAAKPPSSILPFFLSVIATAVILAIAYYLWGK